MNHIYLRDSFGEQWFNYPECYNYIISNIPQNGIFVEVGAWKGRSIAYFAVESINRNKNHKIYAVDIWDKNSIYTEVDSSLYNTFLENTKELTNITPLRMTSIEACQTFTDNSIDAVFIDANHDYEFVKEDILAWLPKVKIGGIMSGHDYTNPHTGVFKAVDDTIGSKNVQIMSNCCWVYRKI